MTEQFFITGYLVQCAVLELLSEVDEIFNRVFIIILCMCKSLNMKHFLIMNSEDNSNFCLFFIQSTH